MSKVSLLVVEDEFLAAADLQQRLEKLGYDVLDIVSSGEKAIQSAAELRPDLVLMDIIIQGNVDGVKAAQKIGSLDIPVVFLTAYSDSATIERAKKSTPYGYIVKPYEDSVLKVTIETAIKKHSSDRESMDNVRMLAVSEPHETHFKKVEPNLIPQVMIVEDEFIMAIDLSDKLESLGYKIVAIEVSGEDAIRTASELHPDIVLMDIILQGEVNGIEAARQINDMDIPVIYLTAHSDPATLEKALETTPYGYVLKPFEEYKVNSAIQTALEKKKSEKEKYARLEKTISTKEEELKMEKEGVFFVCAFVLFLTIYGFVNHTMTWLMYLLFIPASYNIFLIAVSLNKKEEPVPFERPPMVSIIVPAHNEEFTIEKCVRTMAKMDYYLDNRRNYELIVVNDGSTDKTGEILKNLKSEFDFLRIVTRKPPRAGKGKGYVLNEGVRVSRGDIIAVFDADARVNSDFLKLAVPYLNEENVAGVQCRVRMYNKDRNLLTSMQEVEFAIFGNGVLTSRDIMGKNGYLGGNGQLTTRKSLEDIGGWDGFAVTEDLNLSIKLMIKGYKIRYCGEAVVYQEAVPYWKPFFRQRVRWATGNLETLFVYLAPIIDAPIPFYKKLDSIQYLFFLLFIAFVMLGYVVFILNLSMIYVFNMDAPMSIALLSTAAFFPGAFLGVYRDKEGVLKSMIKTIEYWAYCFYLIPLFFAAFLHMVTRKDRKWAKTHHTGA